MFYTMNILIIKNINSISISKEWQIMSKWSSRIIHGISEARSYNVIRHCFIPYRKRAQRLYNCKLICCWFINGPSIYV